MFKRVTKLLMAVLLCILAVSLAGNTASAATAKKLKMKKKKVTIEVGQKKKLAVTVKPKKAKIKWSTSKKKIASVTKKGVVKGKKVGKAKITAKSGKKKAVCTVKVKKQTKYDMASISVASPKVIRVTLKKAKALNAADFVVRIRKNGKGTSRRTLTVASITNSGNKVYDLILSTNDSTSADSNVIENGDYVSVTCSKLNGVKTKELVYYTPQKPYNEYISASVDETIDEVIGFDDWTTGYCSFQVSGLPKGLKANGMYNTYYYRSSVNITGKAAAVQNGTRATITATDELGKKVTRYVYFYIGSSTQIVTYTKTEGMTFIRGDGTSKSIDIYNEGGNGSYTITLNQSNAYITISTYGDISIRDSIPAGTYTIGYTVTDSANRKASRSVKFTIVNGVRVTGTVYAADNSPINSAGVSFVMDDPNNMYDSTYEYDSTYNNTYNVYLAPNQKYDITVSKSGAYQRLYGVTIGKTDVIKNFKLPLYRVLIKAANGVSLSNAYWNWDNGVDKDSNSGSTLYLKKGNYRLTGRISDKPFTITPVSFAVSGNREVQVNLKSNVQKALQPGVPASVNLGSGYSEYTWISFTPAATGTYTITSDRDIYDYYGDEYIEAAVYTDSYVYVNTVEISPSGAESTRELTAGKTYYLRIDGAEEKGAAVITIKQNTAG